MQHQALDSGAALDSEIVQAKKPADVFGEIEPLLSSANPDWNGLLIESYQIRRLEPSPRLCFSERHVVSVQRAGIVKAHEKQAVNVLYPGPLSICPIGASQISYTFWNARITFAMLDPAFVRRAMGDAIDTDAVEIAPRTRIRDHQLDRLILAAEVEVAAGLPAGRIYLESLGTALVAYLLTHHAAKRVTLRHYSTILPQYRLRRAIDLIRENLGKNLSLSELSADAEMSTIFAVYSREAPGFLPISL